MLFLILGLLFAVILVIFFQPLSILDYITQQSSLSPLTQLALMTVSGYGVVLVSRILLCVVNEHSDVSPLGILIWLAVELLMCVTVVILIGWVASGLGRLQLGPLAGDVLLGIVSIFLVPDVVAYQSFRIHELREEIDMMHRRYDSANSDSSVEAGERNINFYDKGGRLVLSTKLANVLYIEAADNYTNIHYINEGKEDTFILHNSLKDMEREYAGSGLIRCHRGYMVNAYNVKLMRKEGAGLLLELNVTSRTLPVSKSYAPAVTRHFSDSRTV